MEIKMLSPVPVISSRANNSIRAAPLATLTWSSDADLFGDAPPWSVLSTSTLVSTLRLDRGLFGTWRGRGIAPVELPSTWFRRTTGRPNYYLASDVLAWLASRRGESFDHLACWSTWLARKTGLSLIDPDGVRSFVRSWAEDGGLVQGDVRFTPAGFAAYLDRLVGGAQS